ncbi:transcriptional regulator, AraC family [Caenispirillum salinarum AK4]|uniref:Transcriptional regulator, AraC family n=1 Tax=Caenispirillum salinarum AK4 TaxID=1238182 RepID=K9H456_9PROT|nr:GlxA family transcriptional regulator [Caenispirillum salinarum]EKV31864.1 transcriptional regulator, AraC family [Caenispirillum salinarum AK4]
MTMVTRVGFLLVPDFSMMALASASEPLRAANLIAGRTLYECELIGLAPGPVTSSAGFPILPDKTLAEGADARAYDLVVLVASLNVRRLQHQALFDWLRRSARHGSRLAAVSTGSLLMARAGLLEGRRCTIHWEMLRDMQEEFPELAVERALYVFDRDRLTCAGGTASLDMMLAWIANEHGGDLTAAIAENFLHTRVRNAAESQRMAVQWRFNISDQRLARAISVMEENMEEPVPPSALADLIGVSPRQLERLFQKAFSKSPARFCLELRLKHAQELLRQSTDSIQVIAHKCGFSSASHFGRAYREIFDSTPASDRRPV